VKSCHATTTTAKHVTHLGQYDKVVSVELKAIRQAWEKSNIELKKKTMSVPADPKVVRLVAIVGGKRHHTRFFPMKPADKDLYGNDNCLPGTFVDRVVTSPYYEDFYLQSHSGIKGTARPTHYFILANGAIESCKTVAHLRKLVSIFHNHTSPSQYPVLTTLSRHITSATATAAQLAAYHTPLRHTTPTVSATASECICQTPGPAPTPPSGRRYVSQWSSI
jgi:hypothetical protein